MSFQTYPGALFLAFGFCACAWPQQSALDQQLASIKLQRESVQKQIITIRKTAPKPLLVTSSPAPVASGISALQPMVTPVSVMEPVMPLWAAPQWDCPPLAAEEAEDLINTAAAKQTIPPALLRSVIKHESGFRPCAVSIKGAQGLMQLMPATAEELGVSDPFDPKQNIRGGAALLRQLLNRYGGDLKLALSAYNAGIGRVDSAGGVPNLPETQHYVSGILDDLGLHEAPAAEQPSTPENDPPN